jgi:hypothetical protein
MTIEGTVPANRRQQTNDTLPPLVAHAPPAADQDDRDNLSAARGIAIGLAVCTVFWGAVAALVALVSN